MMSCEQHDYIEIACMYRYPLKLTLKSGDTVQGRALDTRRNAAQQESMLLAEPDQLIPLDNIASIEVLVQNPHFQKLTF